MSESAGFQGVLRSALWFVEGLFVAREMRDSLIVVFYSMIEGGCLDLALTWRDSLFGFPYGW